MVEGIMASLVHLFLLQYISSFLKSKIQQFVTYQIFHAVFCDIFKSPLIMIWWNYKYMFSEAGQCFHLIVFCITLEDLGKLDNIL